MAAQYNPVELYLQSNAALQYFAQQYTDLERHTLLHRRELMASKHNETLRRIRLYLGHSNARILADYQLNDFSRIDTFLSNNTILNLGLVQHELSSILNHVVRSLVGVKVYLLDEMTNDQISHLIETDKPEHARYVLNACKMQLETIGTSQQALSEVYGKRIEMSKEDLKEELVAAQYSKNPRLNKFEQQTNIHVNALVEETMVDAWREHRSDLLQTWDELVRQDINGQRWSRKIALVRTIAGPDLTRVDFNQAGDRVEVEEVNTPLTASLEGQDTTTCNTPESPDDPSETGDVSAEPDTVSSADLLEAICNNLSQMSLDEKAETASTLKLSATSSNPDNNPIVRFPPTPSPLNHTLHDDTTSSNPDNNPIVRFPPSPSPPNHALHNDTTSCKTEPLISVSSPIREPSFRAIAKHPALPNNEDKHVYNGPATPTVSLPAVVKVSPINAFAGLDRYALDLFAKTVPRK